MCTNRKLHIRLIISIPEPLDTLQVKRENMRATSLYSLFENGIPTTEFFRDGMLKAETSTTKESKAVVLEYYSE